MDMRTPYPHEWILQLIRGVFNTLIFWMFLVAFILVLNQFYRFDIIVILVLLASSLFIVVEELE